eukprot:GHVN01051575.1.p1 GENE.GHVN01051575.1~~GHVN01051575.1.p1  ORF type:complete len:504 (-),score=55.72 GHVN01051575.1:607-2118(-)
MPIASTVSSAFTWLSSEVKRSIEDILPHEEHNNASQRQRGASPKRGAWVRRRSSQSDSPPQSPSVGWSSSASREPSQRVGVRQHLDNDRCTVSYRHLTSWAATSRSHPHKRKPSASHVDNFVGSEYRSGAHCPSLTQWATTTSAHTPTSAKSNARNSVAGTTFSEGVGGGCDWGVGADCSVGLNSRGSTPPCVEDRDQANRDRGPTGKFGKKEEGLSPTSCGSGTFVDIGLHTAEHKEGQKAHVIGIFPDGPFKAQYEEYETVGGHIIHHHPTHAASPTRGAEEETDAPSPPTVFAVDERINSIIHLYQGNLCSLDVDAIVLFTNADYSFSEGATGEAISVGGHLLATRMESMERCRTGEAKMVRAVSLPCRHLIFTAGAKHNPKYELAAANSIHSCFREAMKILVDNDLSSIAFPCIPQLTRGFSDEEYMHIGMRTVRKWIERLTLKVDCVVFVATNEKQAELAADMLHLYFPRTQEVRSLAPPVPADELCFTSLRRKRQPV